MTHSQTRTQVIPRSFLSWVCCVIRAAVASAVVNALGKRFFTQDSLYDAGSRTSSHVTNESMGRHFCCCPSFSRQTFRLLLSTSAIRAGNAFDCRRLLTHKSTRVGKRQKGHKKKVNGKKGSLSCRAVFTGGKDNILWLV